MDIDPLLRRSGENDYKNANNSDRAGGGREGRRHQNQTISSGMTDYPDPPSNISPAQHQPHDPQPSSRHPFYCAPNSQIYAGDTRVGATQSIFSTDSNNPFVEAKRPRACEACRQLKVRCETNDGQDPDNSTCKRCAKAGRICVVTMPARKRQKKTDSRVAELERKIDALTANLQTSRGGGGPPDVLPSATGEHYPERRWLGEQAQRTPSMTNTVEPPTSLAGNKRRNHSINDGDVNESSAAAGEFMNTVRAHHDSPSTVRMGESPSAQWRTPSFATDTGARIGASHEFNSGGDVVDRGIVDVDTASKAFNRYVNDMAPLLPAVVFPPETKMEDVRKAKPTLFHAILAISIGLIKPTVQLYLFNELYRMLAERVFVKSEKSVELVQALILTYLWYDPPDHFEELKFYQLSHMAVILAIDLGISRRARQFSLVGDVMGKRPPSFDLDSPETRRTWLSCYFTSVLSSVALRRVLLIRWQPYMDECVEVLENSPDALPTDKRFVLWIKLCRLMEEVSCQFVADSPSPLLLSDPKVRHTVQHLEEQLAQFRKELPSDTSSLLLRQFEHIVNIHIHEVAMHGGSDSGAGANDSAKEKNRPSRPLSATHVSYLASCLNSIHQALDVTISVDVSQLLCTPTIGLARTAYSAVSLIKLYTFIASPESGVGHVLDLDSLKVEYYLDRIVEHYRAAGELDGGRTAARFSVVLAMLRGWFAKRKEQFLLAEANKEAKTRVNQRNLNYVDKSDDGVKGKQTIMGQTPLHLLSEVAMGGPNSSRSNSTQNQIGTSNSQTVYSEPPLGAPVVPTAVSSDLASRAKQGQEPRQEKGQGQKQGPESWMRVPPVHVQSTKPTTTPNTFYSTFDQQHQQQGQQQHHQHGQEAVHDLPTYPNNTTVTPRPPLGTDGNLLMPSVPPGAPPYPSSSSSLQPTDFMGLQGGFDSDNLITLGSMVDDGLFSYGMFPGFDGGGTGLGAGGNENGGSSMGFW